MATNEVFANGDSLSLPVPNGTASGAPVRCGAYATGLNGVTQTKTGANGEPEGGNATGNATVRLRGVHKLPVSTTTTLNVLDPVYIITGTNVLTPTVGSNKLFGHALEAKGATANQVIRIRIANPTV